MGGKRGETSFLLSTQPDNVLHKDCAPLLNVNFVNIFKVVKSPSVYETRFNVTAKFTRLSLVTFLILICLVGLSSS